MLETWVEKIKTNDPKQVASLYHTDGLLSVSYTHLRAHET